MTAEPSPSDERRFILALAALALVLRVVKLDAPLWYDEILTLVQFVRLPTSELLTTYTTLNNHVLYSLEAKTAVTLFGEHAWALRLPAMLFGVGSIVAAYYLAREVMAVWEARLAAILLTVSYHHVWFSQNARGYTGLLFFSLCATLILVRAARHRSLRPWLIYGVLIALSGYTHLTAALFFASHAVVVAVMLRQRPPVLGLGLGAFLTALLHAPLVPQMVGAFTKVTEDAPAVAAAAASPAAEDWKNPLWTVLELIESFGEIGLLLVPGSALIVFGAISLYRQNRLLAAVYIVNVPLTMVVLVLFGFRLWPRYFFLDGPFFVFCLVRGLFAGGELLRAWAPSEGLKRAVALGTRAAAFGSVLVSLVLLPKNYRWPKQDLEGGLRVVNQHKKPGDHVAVFGLAATPYETYYRAGFTTVKSLAELERLREEPGRTFVVYSFRGHARGGYPDIVSLIDREFTRVEKLPGTLGDGDVFVVMNER